MGPRFVAFAAAMLVSASAAAFPPYRSTDADTARAGELELRLGLIKLARTSSGTQQLTPLLRANLGIGGSFEAILELEHSADEHRLEEGAFGFKWATGANGFGIGVETLALVPVQPAQGGSGIESQVIATWTRTAWQLHVNAGGFHDRRGAARERGWRASALVEFPRERLRPGLELFARRAHMNGARVQAGVGVIARFARLEIRSGVHFGLSDEAPDVEASLWLARAWQVRATRARHRITP